jgi:hypothetical protein
MRGIVEAILIQDQRFRQRADFEEPMPIHRVARQAGDFQAHHQARATEAHVAAVAETLRGPRPTRPIGRGPGRSRRPARSASPTPSRVGGVRIGAAYSRRFRRPAAASIAAHTDTPSGVRWRGVTAFFSRERQRFEVLRSKHAVSHPSIAERLRCKLLRPAET